MPETVGQKGGLYCYLITPFEDNGAVNHGVLERYVDEIIESGTDGLTCVASTTEGVYLTESERFAVVETVCRTANERVPVNVGIGALSSRQSLLYAEQAQKCGASTMMLEMQTYLLPIEFDAVHQHYADVARASSVPIRLYNIPHATRFDFSPDQIAEMADIEGIDSVKDATGDVERVRDIKQLCGDRFALYCGRHHAALGSYEHGAIGWEGAFHPLFAKEIVDLHQALTRPDFKQGAILYRKLEPLFTFFRYYGVPQCMKALSSWTDLDLGNPRPPLQPLSHIRATELRRVMASFNDPGAGAVPEKMGDAS